MRKIHHKIEQLPLFSNIPFSTSIPNRAATKQENDFMVAIREGIQEYVNSGGDYSEPIVFEIDFRKMAALKGLSRWESLQRSYSRTLSKIKSMPLTQTVHYVTPDGEEKEETYWMLSKFTQNMTKGTVKIYVAPAFQEYYISELLRHPDIQIDIRFHESCKCCYTYPFVNWLSARVAEMQRRNEPYPYNIYIGYNDMRLHVPTPLRNGEPTMARPNDYRRNVIEKAIADINDNPYAQMHIENADDIVSSYEKKRISEFHFVVSLCARTAMNSVSLLVNRETAHGIIDDAGIPSWEYIKQKMLDLGYGKSSIPQWEKKRAKAWRALLMTYIQIGKLHREGVKDINAGGYLQTLLKSRLPNATYKQMAVEIVLNAPEFRDEVIDKIAEYRSVTQAQELAITIDKNKKEPAPTPDNNDFLKEYIERNGDIPTYMKKKTQD